MTTTEDTQPNRGAKNKKAPVKTVQNFSEPALADVSSEADLIIHRNILWAMGGGLVPVPMVDVFLISGFQLKMLAELSAAYGIEFSENTGKSVIVSLVGGLGADTIAKSSLSLLKAIPGVGTAVGSVAVPIFAGATTYAVGKVFVKHFESGGTLLDFKAENFKTYYKEMLESGKSLAKKLKRDKSTATPSA